MSWLRIDDKFPFHPKVQALTDREFRVHMTALCYCAQYNTGGRIPPSAWKIIGITQPIADKFLSSGLWDPGDPPAIHDFRTYNPVDPTAAERQRRKRHGTVTDDVTDMSRESHADVTVLTRDHAHAARPVPYPISLPAAVLDDTQAAAATAWIEHWQTNPEPGITNPAAVAAHRAARGETPPKPPEPPDILKACRNWINSPAWDETFTEAMAVEEFQRTARRAHNELAYEDLDQLTTAFTAEHASRYPANPEAEEQAA